MLARRDARLELDPPLERQRDFESLLHEQNSGHG